MGGDVPIIDQLGLKLGLEIYLDVDDYFAITPEGEEGWVTVWINGVVGQAVSLLPVDVGVLQYDRSEGDFDFTEGTSISVTVLLEITGAERFSDGHWQIAPENTHKEVVLNIGGGETYRKPLVKCEVRRAALDAFLVSATLASPGAYAFDAQFLAQGLLQNAYSLDKLTSAISEPIRNPDTTNDASSNVVTGPDVACGSLMFNPQLSANIGSTVQVRAYLKNVGSASASCRADFYLDEASPINLLHSTSLVDLPAPNSESQEVSFSWNTAGVSLGSHKLLAIIRDIVPTDSNFQNNTSSWPYIITGKPTAEILSINPNPSPRISMLPIAFSGRGNDPDGGSIVRYYWLLGDSEIGTTASFSRPAADFSVGEHTIVFFVQDDEGDLSKIATRTFTITPDTRSAGHDLQIQVGRSSLFNLAPGEDTMGRAAVTNAGSFADSGNLRIQILTAPGNESLGETNFPFADLPPSQKRDFDYSIRPSRAYSGNALVKATLEVQQDANSANNIDQVLLFCGTPGRDTVYGPRQEITIGPPAYAGNLRGHDIVVRGSTGSGLQVRIDGRDEIYSFGEYVNFDQFVFQWYGTTTQSGYLFNFWFIDGIYTLTPHDAYGLQGGSVSFVWADTRGRFINADQYNTRFVPDNFQDDVNPWIASKENVGNDYRVNLAIPLTTPPKKNTFTIWLTQGTSDTPIAITRGSITSVATSPPETVIADGPEGSITARTVCFKWGGLDDTTPLAQLKFAYRIDPFEQSFTPFATVTEHCYDLSPGQYTFYVKANDLGGTEDSSPAASSFTILGRHPDVPVNQYPLAAQENLSLTLNLVALVFTDPDVDSIFANAQFRVRTDAGTYASPVWNTGENSAPFPAVKVPAAILQPNTKYWWQVRYQDDSGLWSAWTAETSFTTTHQSPGTIGISRSSGDLIINWNDMGKLEESERVTGPWTALLGATSPWRVTPSRGQRFYRLNMFPGLGIVILRPGSGESLTKGSVYRLQWTATGIASPNWKFFLDKNNVFQRQLAPAPVNDGGGNWHADWTVPTDLADGCDYTVVVKDDSTGVDRHSSAFCITTPAAITITKPTAAESLTKGSVYRLQWTATGIANPNWKFFLDKNNVFQRQLMPTPVDDGGGNWHAGWTVPMDLADGCDYTVVVKDDSTGVDRHSSAFCITTPAAITITKPTAGESLTKDSVYRLQWTASGITSPNWKFFLDKNNVFQRQLTPAPVDDGGGNWHADWTVPTDLADGCDYTVVVKDDSAGVDKHSLSFCVVTQAPVTTSYDDFTDGNATSNPTWQIIHGGQYFVVVDGALAYQGPLGSGHGEMQLPRSAAYGEWRWKRRATGGGHWGNQYVGFVKVDSQNFYEVRIDNASNGDKIHLWKRIGGADQELGNGAYGASHSDWNTIKVTRDGTGLIRVYVNDSIRIEATDTALTLSNYFYVWMQENGGGVQPWIDDIFGP